MRLTNADEPGRLNERVLADCQRARGIVAGHAALGRLFLFAGVFAGLLALPTGCGRGSASNERENTGAVPLTLTVDPIHFRIRGWKVVGALPSLRLKHRPIRNVNHLLRQPFLNDLSRWSVEIKQIGADHPGESNGGVAGFSLQQSVRSGQFTSSSRVASELVRESFCSDYGTADCSDNTSRTVLVPSGKSIRLRDLFSRGSSQRVPYALSAAAHHALVHQWYHGSYRLCMTNIHMDGWGAYSTFSLGRNGLWIGENTGGACAWPVVFVSYGIVRHELSDFGRSIVRSVRRPKLA